MENFSKIAYGIWRIHELTVDKVYENLIELKKIGINVIDTADIYHINNYGDSEKLIGQALEKDNGLKKYFKVVTKCGIVARDTKVKHYNNSQEYIINSANISRENLRIDTIELFLLHRPDYFMDFEEIYQAFKYLKDNNIVKQFGVSNYNSIQFESLRYYLDQRRIDLVTNQIEINAYTSEHYMNDNVFYLKSRSIQPMIWSPMAGGKLFEDNETNKVIKEVAKKMNLDIDTIMISFLNSQGLNPIIILGSHNITRYRNALKGLKIKLTAEQNYQIFKSLTQIDVK